MDVSAGTTLGVEEEFHLVDSETFELVSAAALSAEAEAGAAGPNLHPEMLTSQLESVTPVCTGLRELTAALTAGRAAARAVAGRHAATILATSTHPLSMLGEIEVADRARYRSLQERFGAMVRQFNLCGCHVHVGVPDLGTAVAVLDRARPYLPVLAALTGSSPFHEGRDTGWASFRLAQLALWPQGGTPPVLGSAENYRRLTSQLVESGVADDAGMLLWEVRPSSRYPTIEFRIADMCPDLNHVVLHAGLVRALVRVLAARAQQDVPVPDVPAPLLAAARWRAARYGLTERLWSWRTESLAPAGEVVGDLWAELEPGLADHGEADLLRPLLDQLVQQGTSATRQREVFRRSDDLRAVVRDAVELTARPAG